MFEAAASVPERGPLQTVSLLALVTVRGHSNAAWGYGNNESAQVLVCPLLLGGYFAHLNSVLHESGPLLAVDHYRHRDRGTPNWPSYRRNAPLERRHRAKLCCYSIGRCFIPELAAGLDRRSAKEP